MTIYTEEKLHLPLVRKVFRQADVFFCGLCKAEYASYGEANSCMNQCWFDIHHFYPVVKRKRSLNAWVFRCFFCCRDYTGETQAFECARICAGERNKAQVREQLINEQPLPPPSRPVSRLMMLARVKAIAPAPMPAKAKKQKPEKAEAPTVGDIAPAAGAPGPNKAEKGLHKSSYAREWVRKGERYQCFYCREIHFTKVEALACFAKHFREEDGYEVIVSIGPSA